MGDFNDYPTNESLSEVLVGDNLINLMTTDFILDKGSYNYKGSWNWLDQIIISKNFLTSNVTNIFCRGIPERLYALHK